MVVRTGKVEQIKSCVLIWYIYPHMGKTENTLQKYKNNSNYPTIIQEKIKEFEDSDGKPMEHMSITLINARIMLG